MMKILIYTALIVVPLIIIVLVYHSEKSPIAPGVSGGGSGVSSEVGSAPAGSEVPGEGEVTVEKVRRKRSSLDLKVYEVENPEPNPFELTEPSTKKIAPLEGGGGE